MTFKHLCTCYFFQLDLKLLQLIAFANKDQTTSNNKKQKTHTETIPERCSRLSLGIKIILCILVIVLSPTVFIITLLKLQEEFLSELLTAIEITNHINLSKLMNDNIKLQRDKMLKSLEEA